MQLSATWANRCMCKKFPPLGLWRGCCCLIPLKEINERSTNSEGGDRRRDEREAARDGGSGRVGGL